MPHSCIMLSFVMLVKEVQSFSFAWSGKIRRLRILKKKRNKAGDDAMDKRFSSSIRESKNEIELHLTAFAEQYNGDNVDLRGDYIPNRDNCNIMNLMLFKPYVFYMYKKYLNRKARRYYSLQPTLLRRLARKPFRKRVKRQ